MSMMQDIQKDRVEVDGLLGNHKFVEEKVTYQIPNINITRNK